ncbi:MAG: hypothetical protein AAB539_02730 [Patescibacteria group bacterium]
MITRAQFFGHLRHIATARTIIIASASCVLVFGFIAWRIVSDATHGSAVSRQFTIKTRPILQLVPHPHNPSTDTVVAQGHGVVAVSDIWVTDTPLWVTALEWRAENAPQEVIHHALVQRLDRPDPLCPASWFQEIATTAIDAPRHIEFPEPFGIFLPAGTPIGISAMLHNPLPPYGSGGTYDNVAARLNLTVEAATLSRRFRALEYNRLRLSGTPCVYPLRKNVAPAEVFSIPAGARHWTMAAARPEDGHAESGAYVVQRPGTLVGFGGHTHGWEGGEELALLLNGRALFSLNSRQKGDWLWLWETPFYWIRRRVRLEAGDVLSISATYSNLFAEDLTGSAMGMVGFYAAWDE